MPPIRVSFVALRHGCSVARHGGDGGALARLVGGTSMDARLSRRGTALVAVGAVVLATAAAVTVGHGGKGDEKDRLPWKARELQGAIQGETGELSKEEHGREPGDESREAGVIATQFA